MLLTPMLLTPPPPVALPVALPVDTAVLLVLLPILAPDTPRQKQADTLAGLRTLQNQLGTAIRVLVIDEASHAIVVRSFQPTDLPAFVLVQQGVEIWRQPGLPEGETIGPLLLRKLRDAADARQATSPGNDL